MTLFRPVGQKEYELIAESGFSKFPPRLYWQPIFYPVLNREYAVQIARDWNTTDANSGYVGYVLEFEIDDDFISQYEIHTVGARDIHREYWIPAEDLDKFNQSIVKGKQGNAILVVDKFIGNSVLNIELKQTSFFLKAQLRGTCYHEFKPGKWKEGHWSESSIYLHNDDIVVFDLVFEKTLKKYDICYGQEVDCKETEKLITAFKQLHDSLTDRKDVIKALREIDAYDMIISNSYKEQLIKIDFDKLVCTVAYFIDWLKSVLSNYGCFALLGI